VVNKVGVLALQGNFTQHQAVLSKLGINNSLILYPKNLDNCDLLIIPGGESTAISKQINRNGFRASLLEFIKERSVFGTCAGMILLSKIPKSDNLDTLCAMNFRINRNAYGAQINSFKAELDLDFDKKNKFQGYFIRAPKITYMQPDLLSLAYYNNDPVMITDGMHYATSFHPEIGNDHRVHEYVINNLNEK
jgi:5'-phosphate synthase pdxT subunit